MICKMPNLQMRSILWLNSQMKITEFINTELESETRISKDHSIFKAHILSNETTKIRNIKFWRTKSVPPNHWGYCENLLCWKSHEVRETVTLSNVEHRMKISVLSEDKTWQVCPTVEWNTVKKKNHCSGNGINKSITIPRTTYFSSSK